MIRVILYLLAQVGAGGVLVDLTENDIRLWIFWLGLDSCTAERSPGSHRRPRWWEPQRPGRSRTACARGPAAMGGARSRGGPWRDALAVVGPLGSTADAVSELAAPTASFTAGDHVWVRDHTAGSLAEIEAATLRVAAPHTSRNLSHAAARLGMAPVSLSRWLGRRQGA